MGEASQPRFRGMERVEESSLKGEWEVEMEGGDYTVTPKESIERMDPEDFELETTTVWSFPKRGDWATHKGDFRGNWAPQVPRNLIHRYSEPGDTVLDPFVGGGTTLIETKVTGRRGIGVDINKSAADITLARLDFEYKSDISKDIKQASLEGEVPPNLSKTPELDEGVLSDEVLPQEVYLGDARNLDELEDESMDLICAHPPYANIIDYAGEEENNIGAVRDLDEFAEHMRECAKEFYRVLKPDHYCGALIGDTRRKKHAKPIGFLTLRSLLKEGFVLKELVIKVQHQMKSTGFWAQRSKKYNFLLLKHEFLFVLRKPKEGEGVEKLHL